MAYHADKIKRGYDLCIDVFGADHMDAYPDVLEVVKQLGYDESKIKIILDGKLFAKKSFIVFFKNSNGFKKKYYKTNIKGIAKIDTKKGGLYLISAVDLKTLNLIDRLKYNANFFSRWASLTFKKH